jgi:hypothetical protein
LDESGVLLSIGMRRGRRISSKRGMGPKIMLIWGICGVVTGVGRGTMKQRRWSREEALMARMPRDSGIMNQEGQCVNVKDGSIHVLMRDTRLSGRCMWKHL